MLDSLILLVFNSALCFGFWNACLYEVNSDGVRLNDQYQLEAKKTEIKGILWRLEKWASNKWFYKPLCGCLPCMASLHSIYPYWTYMYATNSINIHAVLFYPVYILALSGVNYLIDRE